MIKVLPERSGIVEYYCIGPAYPSTTPPVLNQPNITSKKNVIDTRGAPFVATKFSIKCDLGYPQKQVDDGARFLAVLESNGVPIVNVTRRSTEPFVNFDEGYLYGRLGTNVSLDQDDIIKLYFN